MASVGPCPEFPGHGRDEYRVTPAGEVIRTRYVLASDHKDWDCPGARPFITPNRSTVTAQRTINAVAECLAAPAMVPMPVQQQQARDLRAGPPEPTPTTAPLGLIRGVWTDEQIAAVIGDLLDKSTTTAALAVDERLQQAAASAVSATKIWLGLYERQGAGEHIDYIAMHDARERLQDAHRAYSDMAEIVTLMHLPEGWTVWSHREGLAAYRDGCDDPDVILPRGICHVLARLVLRTYDQAYDTGKAHGRYEIQAGLRQLLDVAAA